MEDTRLKTRLFPLAFGAVLTIAMIAGIVLYKGMEGASLAVIPWGMMVVGYTFFAIMSGGIADSTIIAAYTRQNPSEYKLLKRNLYTALAVLIPGVILVFADLQHPVHAYWFYISFNPASRIAWNAVLYVLYGIFLISLLVLLIRRGEEAASTATGKLLALATLATSIILEMNLGMAFGSNIAILTWYGVYSGILFVASAFALGGAWLSITRARGHPEEVPKLSTELIITTIILGFIVFWGLLSLYSWGLTKDFAYEVVGGDYASYFWAGFIIPGLLASPVLSYIARKKSSAFSLAVAGVLTIVGIAILLSVPYSYGGQYYRLEINELYTALGHAMAGEEATIRGYLISPEALAFVGGFGLAVLVEVIGLALLPLEPGKKRGRL